jgi:hypothetical protein
MFLPRQKPHAFLIESEEIHFIVFLTPGGFFDAINNMNVPAERMDIPTDSDTITYRNADLANAMEGFRAGWSTISDTG